MLVAGLAVAHAPFVRSAVARAIVSRVGSGLDTVLALDRLDYNLLTLRFTGTGLSLSAKGSPGPAYFRADRVTVRLRPSALLGHLRFASVELVHPSFTAAREEGGRFNLPHTGPSTGPPAPIEIGRLTVEALDAAYLDAPRLSFVARQLSIDLRPEGSRIRGRLVSAQSGSMRMAPGPEIGFALDGQLAYEPGGVRLSPLTLTTPGAALRVEGSLVFDKAPARADLAISGSVGLDLAARLWPALAPARGQVSATVRLAGALSHPTVVFDATADAASVRALAVEGATAHGSLEGSTLTLSPVSVRIARGRVEGTAIVRLADLAVVESSLSRNELQARWDQVDLAALLRSLNVPSSWIAPGARAAGEGKARWNGSNLSSLSVTATAKVAAPQAHRASAGVAAADLALRVSDSRWWLQVGEVAGAGARVTGQIEGPMASGEIARFPVAGRLDAEVRPGELGPWAGSKPDVASALARTSGRAAVSLVVAGTLGAPEATAEVTMPDLHVEGLGAGSMRGRAHVDRRHAAIEDLALVIGDSTVRATGALPFDNAPIDARFSGSVGSLAPYVPSAGARWLPAGTIAVAGRVGGSFDRLLVEAVLNGAEMSWNDVPLGRTRGEVRIADGRAAGSLSVPSLHTTLDGSLSLSAPHGYDVSARVDGSDLATLASLAARAGAPAIALTGSVRANVHAKGSVEEAGPPAIEAGVDALDGTIAGRTLRLDAPTRVLVSSDGLTLQPARLHVDGAVIDASGALNASAGGSLRATVDGSIDAWQSWLRDASGISDLQAAGRRAGQPVGNRALRPPGDCRGRLAVRRLGLQRLIRRGVGPDRSCRAQGRTDRPR